MHRAGYLSKLVPVPTNHWGARLQALVASLSKRSWTIEYRVDRTAPLLPPEVASRYPLLPLAVTEFLGSFARCSNLGANAWFLTSAEYAPAESQALRWNQYETMGLDACAGPDERQAIEGFWNLHFPFMLAVHSDYDYLAVSLAPHGFGSVVHGCAPEWESTTMVAESFEHFIEAFTVSAMAPAAEYPLKIFL